MQDAFTYDERILDQLRGHGLSPLPTTPPQRVRDALSDLYRYEIRRLRSELLAGRIVKQDYAPRVIELRQRYWLLSVPTDAVDKGPRFPCRTLRSSASSTSVARATRPARPRSARPLRLARPGDARRLRRHDRQRQDRPVHLADRRGGHRRRPGHRDRSEGRPRQPAADLPEALAPRISGRGSTKTRRGARA